RVPIFKEEPQFFFAATVVHVSSFMLNSILKRRWDSKGAGYSRQGFFADSSSACHALSTSAKLIALIFSFSARNGRTSCLELFSSPFFFSTVTRNSPFRNRSKDASMYFSGSNSSLIT